jgi:pyruvate kinase
VEMLVKIAAAIEPHRPAIKVEEMLKGFKGSELKDRLSPAHLIALGVETSLEYVTPAAVFVPTRSGATARRIASFRLPVWIVAVSSQKATCQLLQFSSGVCPVHEPDHPEDWSAYAGKWVSAHGLSGDLVILTEGPSTKHPEANHRLEVIDLQRK